MHFTHGCCGREVADVHLVDGFNVGCLGMQVMAVELFIQQRKMFLWMDLDHVKPSAEARRLTD